MNRWEFKRDPGGTHAWRWQTVEPNTGSVVSMSGGLFATLQDCVSDARLHGFEQQASACPSSAQPLDAALRNA